MSDPVINGHSRVTLHFSLKLEDGTPIDSTLEKKPATFTVGDGSLLPGFERALFGLRSGDETEIEIAPEAGFGQRNPANIQHLRRDRFSPELALTPGLVVSFDNGNGELPGVVQAFDDDGVTVDFNHPLAGQTILFAVKIIAVASIN